MSWGKTLDIDTDTDGRREDDAEGTGKLSPAGPDCPFGPSRLTTGEPKVYCRGRSMPEGPPVNPADRGGEANSAALHLLGDLDMAGIIYNGSLYLQFLHSSFILQWAPLNVMMVKVIWWIILSLLNGLSKSSHMGSWLVQLKVDFPYCDHIWCGPKQSH